MQAFSSYDISEPLLFDDLGSRKVVADFSGGHISSDGGALLLRQLDQSLGLCEELAGCFSDFRDQRFVEHSLPELIKQRVFAQALGDEDLNDHDTLRRDPLMAVAGRKRGSAGIGSASRA